MKGASRLKKTEEANHSAAEQRGRHGDPETSRGVGSHQVTVPRLLQNLLIQWQSDLRLVRESGAGTWRRPASRRFKESSEDDDPIAVDPS
jgi:hypothetical protein